MGSRLKLSLLVLVLLFVGHSVTRTQQNPYRLKETNQRKLCLECHADFTDTLKKRFVHTAVQTGECSGCHDPHVSSHGKLLSADGGQMCATCHGSVVSDKARSTHKVVVDGECSKCHDPHASDNAGILVARGNDLCVSCHTDLGAAIEKAKFKHTPVQQGCTSCHAPHASDQSTDLLKTAVPALCVNCHKPDSPAFVSRHMRYPVATASCTSCHDPHGSDTPALLLNNVHAPVRDRTCTQCHEPPDSATPFATKRDGYELCRGCHNEMVTTILAKPRLHWPVADKQGCANCHNPHASKQAGLLKSETATLCATCHAETSRRIASATVPHAPARDGMCGACHSPHGASGLYLMDQPSINEGCSTCHGAEHSAHPVGEGAIDPRNKNLRVTCISCHDWHGNDIKRMLLAPTNVELCTQCHKQFSR